MVDYKEVVGSEKEAKRFFDKLKDSRVSAGSFSHHKDYADFASSFLQNVSQYKHILIHHSGVAAKHKSALKAHAALESMQAVAKEIVDDAGLLKRIPYRYESAFRNAAGEKLPHPVESKVGKNVVDALKSIKSDLVGHDGDGGFAKSLSNNISHLKPHMHGYSSVREDVFHHAHEYIRKVQRLAELKKNHSDVLNENKALVNDVVGAVNNYRELLVDGVAVVMPADWSESMRSEFLGLIKSEFSLDK